MIKCTFTSVWNDSEGVTTDCLFDETTGEVIEYHTPNQVAEYIDSLYENIIYIFKGVVL